MAVMKTPGVYIVEKNAFPNSVVEVATAVPAFVGYTEFATDSGKPLSGKPFRISSLAEFQRYFGGPPPATFEIAKAAAGGDFSASIDGKDVAFDINLLTTQFRLFYAMKHFFQNYGGACWVVSVGDYGVDATGKTTGKREIKRDELSAGIDALELEQEPTMLVIPDAMGLKTAAESYVLQQAMLKHCGFKMQNRFAILDVYGATGGRATEDPNVAAFRGNIGVNDLKYGAAYYPWVHTRILTESDLEYRQFTNKPEATFDKLLGDLQPVFREAKVLEDATKTDAQWKTAADAAKVGETAVAKWKAEAKAADEARAKTDANFKARPEQALTAEVAALKIADKATEAWIAARQEQTHNALQQGSVLFQTILKLSARKLNLLPPSAAMAGLYTMVDNTRGVWKAPANVSLMNALEPAISISHDEQEKLNVDAQGKSINAIRSFIGEGTLVWGARTLDGNSLDWRYINVRRTMIMLEESCKLAAKAMVFEPNVAGTWLTIKSMIQNFLTGIWRRGGLMGAVPDDAFSVHCGLGETMTPEDVLEGILKVTVLVAMVRPAEFIEITFQQQMPKS